MKQAAITTFDIGMHCASIVCIICAFTFRTAECFTFWSLHSRVYRPHDTTFDSEHMRVMFIIQWSCELAVCKCKRFSKGHCFSVIFQNNDFSWIVHNSRIHAPLLVLDQRTILVWAIVTHARLCSGMSLRIACK